MEGARLLVVEDDTNAREALVELLRCEGYMTVAAPDGLTALGRLRTHVVDAVVVDLGLPDIDGVDVIQAARTLPNKPAVIVFTGHYRYKRAAEAAGCDAFVLKPDVEKLLAEVSALVGAVPFARSFGADRPDVRGV